MRIENENFLLFGSLNTLSLVYMIEYYQNLRWYTHPCSKNTFTKCWWFYTSAACDACDKYHVWAFRQFWIYSRSKFINKFGFTSGIFCTHVLRYFMISLTNFFWIQSYYHVPAFYTYSELGASVSHPDSWWQRSCKKWWEGLEMVRYDEMLQKMVRRFECGIRY